MMWGWGWSWGMGLMMLFGLVCTAGFIALIVWLIVHFSRSESTTVKRSSALDIAQERYAKGEISKAEFDQIKKDLS